MAFIAKLFLPLPGHAYHLHSLVEQIIEHGISFFGDSLGHQMPIRLATLLHQQQRPASWLRLGDEDRDPATLLSSLIAAAQQLNPQVGLATLEHMRHQPGAVMGWSQLYAHLAREFGELLPGCVLVLQDAQVIFDGSLTQRLLCTHFLPLLATTNSCIIISQRMVNAQELPPNTHIYHCRNLALKTSNFYELAEQYNTGLKERLVKHLFHITQGRSGLIESLLASVPLLGSAGMQRMVQRARNASDLLMGLTLDLLHDSPLIDQYALALQLQVRYKHPSIIQAVFDMEVPLQGPWQVALQQGWSYIDALWSEPLQQVLAQKVELNPRMLSRAIDSLVQQDGLEQAISLALNLGAFDSAAQLLSNSINSLMDRGSWINLRTWINQIPNSTLQDWPWLIYANGEISVVESQFPTAQKQFALATQRFQIKLDSTGTCQSLLAESALASWQGDQQRAYSCAYHANDIAQQTGLHWYAGWAAWQLGCILAAWNDLDSAIAYFQQAITIAATLNNQVMLNMVEPIEELTQQQYQLHQKRVFYERALAETQQSEQQIAEQLRQRLSSLPENLDLLLGTYGWSYTPLMAKLPVFPHTTAKQEIEESQNWWQRIAKLFRSTQTPTESQVVPPYTRPAAIPQAIETPYLRPAARPHAIEHEQPQSWQSEATLEQHESVLLERTVGEAISDQMIYLADTIHLEAESNTETEVELNEEKECIVESIDHKTETLPAKSDRPTLRIYCFGVFRVYQNNQEITQWAGLRGQAILKYLVAHHNQAVSKDTLMDVFWSDATPDAARRNLHQAIYSLRQSLKLAQSDFQHILFEHNCYRLNPELDIWIDVLEFLDLIQKGQRFGAAMQIEQASAAYYHAEELYQGSFMQDDLYEEWTHVHRERLQTLFINMLEWQIEQASATARHAEVIALSQKLLQHDSGYEYAHCQIMQAYVALGLRHRAIKQFQICKERLREAYDLEPSAQTITLYRRIVQSA